MPDTNHVIVRCPNGHDLQASKSDLGRPLSCPLCSTVFHPGGGEIPTQQGPVSLGYTDGSEGLPVKLPTYTNWLIGLWLASTGLGIINQVAQLGQGAATQTPNPFAMLSGCLVSVVVIAAIVLQLVWIHRIHKDAWRARGYREVTSGMALGLSFIPFFNYIWTGWILKKLAVFAVQNEEQTDTSAEPHVAVRAGNLCFWFGIVKVAAGVLGAVAGGLLSLNMLSEMGGMSGPPPASFDPFANAGPVFFVVIGIATIADLASVIVYVWAVKIIQAALYKSLGAGA